MLKRIIILLSLLYTSSYGFCWYVDCTPTVTGMLADYDSKSSIEFAELTSQKNALQVKYNKYLLKLDDFIELQVKDTKLKTEMILQLKKKELRLENRIKMLFLKTKEEGTE